MPSTSNFCTYLYFPYATQKRAIGCTARQYGIPLPWDEPIIEDENAPQHNCTSVDCGVAVLYVILKYYEQQPVIKADAESELEWAGK